jgi:hypothetical protein
MAFIQNLKLILSVQIKNWYKQHQKGGKSLKKLEKSPRKKTKYPKLIYIRLGFNIFRCI